MGVFAPLTGAIGAMQAMEAIKLVAGIGTSLSGKLQVYDALNAEWRSVKVGKDAACRVCGKR
jgi:adenylyltransferase/sulfurtransferase